jgi:threonine aldolase
MAFSMEIKRSFASDNNSGIHPKILEAIASANIGHVKGYGADEFTKKAIKEFKKEFGDDTDVYFVFNGTGANVVGLQSVTNSYNSIICTEAAHINEDECGAPEFHTGCKLIDIHTPDAKLNVKLIREHLKSRGDEHQTQTNVISLTQSTEFGTVYSLEEIKEITKFAHDNDIIVHMDGARISNAAVSLGLSFVDFTKNAGVDILSFGGTKNGLMLGEAILFFNPKLSVNTKFFRKQSMQLASKMRFIAVQFEEFLKTGLWRTNAQHANSMAQLLASKIERIPNIKIVQKTEANGVFVQIPRDLIPRLQEKFFFYIFDEKNSVARFMCSFDTQISDIEAFSTFLESECRNYFAKQK